MIEASGYRPLPNGWFLRRGAPIDERASEAIGAM
jgi:hypothetical protein